MAIKTNFKVSKGFTAPEVSNLVGLNITDDFHTVNSDISFSNGNLNIKNKSTTGSLILGTNNTPAITIDNSQNVSIAGNLTVGGATELINSTVTLLQDPIMTLGGITDPLSNDAKDRGIEFKWHNGTSAKNGFFGFDNSTGYFTFIPDGVNSNEVYSGAFGDIQAANFRGALIGNATSASSLESSRNIELTGDVTGTVSFNGSSDVSISASLATGVMAIPGTYKSVTVNSKGLITAGSNPTTLSGFGITDGATINNPTFTGTITTPTINTTNTTGLSLTNATSNLITFNNVGTGNPTFNTRSVGTKLVLYPALSTTMADYAIGISSNTLWNSVPDTTNSFKWYGGTTLAATLTGTGSLTIPGNITSSDLFVSRTGDAAKGFIYFGNTGTKYIGYDGTNFIFQAVGSVYSPTFTSSIATGTAPITVSSTTQCPNLNASLLGGFGASQTSGLANRVVVSNSSGYIANNYFNMSANDVGDNPVSRIVVETNSDGYLRWQNPTNFNRRSNLGRVVNYAAIAQNGRLYPGPLWSFYYPMGYTTWYLPTKANTALGDTIEIVSMHWVNNGGWQAAATLTLACDTDVRISTLTLGESLILDDIRIQRITLTCNWVDANFAAWSIS